MAATLSADNENQPKTLQEKIDLKVDEVKTIEDLTKVLPKVKREKKTPTKTKFPFRTDEDVSNDEDKDVEEEGAKTVTKLMWFCRTNPIPKGHFPLRPGNLRWKV